MEEDRKRAGRKEVREREGGRQWERERKKGRERRREISPSNEYSGLISFKIDWFNILAVQGTFRSLLQHYSSKASIIWHSSFYTVQLSQQYMTTGKTIALTIWTFVGKGMSLLFSTLSRFVIAFLPKSNHLLISWLQSPLTVILEPKKRKSVTTSTFSPLSGVK